MTAMTDEAFDALWNDRIEAAACSGDEAAIEAAMTAANDAYVQRFGAVEMEQA